MMIQVRNVQLYLVVSKVAFHLRWTNLLMDVHTNERIRGEDSSDSNRGSEVGQWLDSLTIPWHSWAESPDCERNKEHNSGLVKTIEHVGPELGLRILQTPYTSNVQLWECQCSLCIDVLVECYVGVRRCCTRLRLTLWTYHQEQWREVTWRPGCTIAQMCIDTGTLRRSWSHVREIFSRK